MQILYMLPAAVEPCQKYLQDLHDLIALSKEDSIPMLVRINATVGDTAFTSSTSSTSTWQRISIK